MIKIKKGSLQYNQNLERLKYLRSKGVNVKLDGSWGPWQQKQYDRLNSNNKLSWFTRAMIGAAMAENPAVMTASGWKQDKNGNWKQERTTESDKLADNLSVLSWSSPTHPGTAFVEKVLLPGIIKLTKAVPRIVKIFKNKPEVNNTFKSDLDWSENWFKLRENLQYDTQDILALKKHIPEYLEIERTAKANGTWLLMPDGSTWTGDPRSWVLLMSKDGQKLSKLIWWHGDTDMYINDSGLDVTPITNGKRILWGSSEPHIARSYTNSDNKVFPIALELGRKPFRSINAEGRLWRSAYKKNGEYYDTNTFSRENLSDGEYLVIDNVIDKGSMPITLKSKYFILSFPNETYTDFLIRSLKGNDIIIGRNTPRKYLLGNNGNFDLSNPNVYKVLLPLTGISYGISGQNN